MRLIPLLVSFAALFLISSVAVYCIKPKTNVVLFDEGVVKGTLIRQLAEHQASKVQVRITTKKFNDTMSDVLAHYAKQHGVVIINRHMALSGGEDVTEQIASELSRVMRARS